MSLEPSLIATVERLDRAEREAALPSVDWDDFCKCSQVCGAETGEPCTSLSGKVVDGRPDGLRTPLTHAHAARKRRAR